MATSKQKAFYVVHFAKTESAITVQRAFCLSSVVSLQIIITFLGSIIGLKQLVTGSAYLDALQLWLFPQSEESEPNNFNWQQDGSPPE
ncbi:uncharacterized protein TNCV_3716781 [Trichonephila clavipes]|nr:uncharacterized protein TNCV_3716781 [Trichonephila clavipes]